MRNLFAAAKMFALLNLLFLPAIGVLLLVAFINGERWWFAFLGLPALTINAGVVFAKRQRDWVWKRATAMVGQPREELK